MSGSSSQDHKKRTRVLFIGEGVTLAHVSRPLALFETLSNHEDFEAIFACDKRYHSIASQSCDPITISSLACETFESRLKSGAPLFDLDTLKAHAREDLELLKATAPDLVVGDFRLSLSTSARVAGIPYINITNAYWTNEASTPLPVADIMPFHIMSRVVGNRAATSIIGAGTPLFLKLHAQPHGALRRSFGLAPLKGDVRSVVTDGDLTLFADVPEMVPLSSHHSRFEYLGHVQWSMPCELPSWWRKLDPTIPIVIVSLGSSGHAHTTRTAIEALIPRRCSIVVATTGHSIDGLSAPNLYATRYLPLGTILERASLIICNGGSPTAYSALSRGVPVLGIAANTDQYLCMRHTERHGSAALARSGSISRESLGTLIDKILCDEHVTTRAREAQQLFAQYDYRTRFVDALKRLRTNVL